jgi:acyl-CoA thioesterase
MSYTAGVSRAAGPASSADRYATELGARVVAAEPGRAVVELVVAERHLNDRGIAHGGALFSLADVALAVASNPQGQVALVPTATVHFLRPARLGARLEAEARVEHRGRTLGLYSVRISDDDTLVARLIGQSFAVPGWTASDAEPDHERDSEAEGSG